MIRQAHLKLIAGHSVRHGIRGGAGLVSLFLTLVIGLVLASVVISPLDAVDQQIDRMEQHAGGDRMTDAEKAETRQRVNLEVVKIAGKAINWVVEPDADQLDYLTSQKPAIVSAILVMLFLVTPLFSCLAGFNQTSGDIGSKGLRFLLIRTERQNIFIGRFIGTFLFAALVNLALFLILAIYMAAKVKVHPAGDMVLWLGQGYLRVMLFTLPYIAVCAWVSCAIDSPFGSLVLALMATYLFPLIVGRGAALNSSVGYLNYLTPWGWKYWLLEPIASAHFLGAAVAMLAFGAGFLFLGMRYFKKRDL
jgi:ABC-2 type transport system permease protein